MAKTAADVLADRLIDWGVRIREVRTLDQQRGRRTPAAALTALERLARSEPTADRPSRVAS